MVVVKIVDASTLHLCLGMLGLLLLASIVNGEDRIVTDDDDAGNHKNNNKGFLRHPHLGARPKIFINLGDALKTKNKDLEEITKEQQTDHGIIAMGDFLMEEDMILKWGFSMDMLETTTTASTPITSTTMQPPISHQHHGTFTPMINLGDDDDDDDDDATTSDVQ